MISEVFQAIWSPFSNYVDANKPKSLTLKQAVHSLNFHCILAMLQDTEVLFHSRITNLSGVHVISSLHGCKDSERSVGKL